jgi:hypothetical protein
MWPNASLYTMKRFAFHPLDRNYSEGAAEKDLELMDDAQKHISILENELARKVL